MTDIPVIRTRRLTLRGHRIEDFEDCLSMWSDPKTTRHIGPASDPGEVWARMTRYVGHWALAGYGYWLIEETDTGAMVGEAGLADFKRGIHPVMDGVPEAGWIVRPEHQGKGYGREAVDATLAWADSELDAPRTCCLISPENTPSIRLAAHAGYEEDVHAVFKGAATVIYFRERGKAVIK